MRKSSLSLPACLPFNITCNPACLCIHLQAYTPTGEYHQKICSQYLQGLVCLLICCLTSFTSDCIEPGERLAKCQDAEGGVVPGLTGRRPKYKLIPLQTTKHKFMELVYPPIIVSGVDPGILHNYP